MRVGSKSYAEQMQQRVDELNQRANVLVEDARSKTDQVFQERQQQATQRGDEVKEHTKKEAKRLAAFEANERNTMADRQTAFQDQQAAIHRRDEEKKQAHLQQREGRISELDFQKQRLKETQDAAQLAHQERLQQMQRMAQTTQRQSKKEKKPKDKQHYPPVQESSKKPSAYSPYKERDDFNDQEGGEDFFSAYSPPKDTFALEEPTLPSSHDDFAFSIPSQPTSTDPLFYPQGSSFGPNEFPSSDDFGLPSLPSLSFSSEQSSYSQTSFGGGGGFSSNDGFGFSSTPSSGGFELPPLSSNDEFGSSSRTSKKGSGGKEGESCLLS